MPNAIEKIMETARVSRATAYRALAGSPAVSEETRKRVAEAAQALDEPVIRKRRAWSRLALWVPDVGTIVSSPNRSAMIRAVEKAAARRDVSFELISESMPEDPADCVAVLKRHRVGAVMLVSFFSARRRRAMATYCPVMLFMERGDDEPISDILPDDFQAGYLATRYLISHGHRRIAAAVGAGRRSVGFSQRFVGGYLRACTEAGIAVNEKLILKDVANVTPMDSQDALPPAGDEFLKLRPRPTAVIGRRITVIGMIHRFSRDGLSVPQDISVVAYGPKGWDMLGPPGLTQVQYDPQEMAETAFDVLTSPRALQVSLTAPVKLLPGSSVKDLAEKSS